MQAAKDAEPVLLRGEVLRRSGLLHVPWSSSASNTSARLGLGVLRQLVRHRDSLPHVRNGLVLHGRDLLRRLLQLLRLLLWRLLLRLLLLGLLQLLWLLLGRLLLRLLLLRLLRLLRLRRLLSLLLLLLRLLRLLLLTGLLRLLLGLTRLLLLGWLLLLVLVALHLRLLELVEQVLLNVWRQTLGAVEAEESGLLELGDAART